MSEFSKPSELFEFSVGSSGLGHIAIGKFDGTNISLVYSLENKVIVYSPSRESTAFKQFEVLNVNDQITALDYAVLEEKPVLLIGTPTTLQAYDILNNSDLFFKEISDGVNAICSWNIDGSLVVLAGGNCAVQGFDSEGNDVYWTVVSDEVTKMIPMGEYLLVGTQDGVITKFKGDDIVFEYKETYPIVALCDLGSNTFAFANENATVGIYKNTKKIWSMAYAFEISSLASFDINSDENKELVIGCANGRYEARTLVGAIVYESSFKHKVASLMEVDYNKDGQNILLVVSAGGLVRGVSPAVKLTKEQVVAQTHSVGKEEIAQLKSAYSKLMETKQGLLLRLSALKETVAPVSEQHSENIQSAIPQDSKISCDILYQNETLLASLDSLKDDILIKSAVVSIYAKETATLVSTIYATNAESSRSLKVPIQLQTEALVDIQVRAILGTLSSTIYHVLETTVTFGYRYHLLKTVPETLISSVVCFTVAEPIAKFTAFLEAFVILAKETKAEWLVNDEISIFATQFIESSPWFLSVKKGSGSLKVEIKAAAMNIIASLVQHLFASSLKLTQLQPTTCELKSDFEKLAAVTSAIENLNELRTKMTSESADLVTGIKYCIVKAEDSRILADMRSMKQAYRSAADLNRDAMLEHLKRLHQHSELVENLKILNGYIQKSASLRIGSYKTDLITSCREAIKAQNFQLLLERIGMN